MHRRGFIQLMAAGAAAGSFSSAWAAGRRSKVIVVGAGIMGASIAYHLAKRGADVTLLEKNAPASGTTRDSFAWLNAGKSPRHYYDFNLAGLLGWRRLQLEIGPDLPMQWGGGVRWSTIEPSVIATRRRLMAEKQAWGYPSYEIDAADVAKLAPGVVTGGMNYGEFASLEGTVDPVVATNVLLARAKAFGAKVVYPCEITGLDLATDKVRGVRTTQGAFEGDYVVLASGNGIPGIAAMADFVVPLIESKGTMVKTKPMRRVMDRLIAAPGGDLKQNFDGSVLVGIMGENHVNPEDYSGDGSDFLAHAAKFIPATSGAKLDRIIRGFRVMPRDGMPIFDRAPKYSNLFVAAQHSAMSCGPIAGQLVAMELLDQVSLDAFKPYRLSRFA